MDLDDPRTPLLGSPNRQHRLRRVAAKLCGVESWRKRLPITIWLPDYKLDYLFRDAIAGITVGLTSIPQGIAYAMVAGVPPQVGLYSSIFPGVVYAFFGSCKDVTVGPTAIISALLAKYVAYSVDFAYLASFLSGVIILLLGVMQLGLIPVAIILAMYAEYIAYSVEFAYLASFLSGVITLLLRVLQLGFLLDFISKPVISGFTTAAALQIGAAQLKSLFRIKGSSGDTFFDAIINFIKHIKTVQLWDTVLGLSSIVALILLKKLTLKTRAEDSKWRVFISQSLLYTVRARNAIVVFAAAILAYILHARGLTPFALTGEITGGLPQFGPPAFSTTINGTTVHFDGMLQIFGAEGFVLPLVAILESIAIAKAFAGSTPVDATQEMIAVGACNLLSSFCQAMPATGSFTRTALNHASGVVTPAGCLFKATVVLLAVTLLSKQFYFIPRATLAAVIMVAMFSIIELIIVRHLWRNSKVELCVWAVTVGVGVGAGLEYGIAAGAGCDAARALLLAARPALPHHYYKVGNVDCVSVSLTGNVTYSAAGHVAARLRALAASRARLIVLDARQMHAADITVTEELLTSIEELERLGLVVLLWNFPERSRRLIEDLRPTFAAKFVTGPSIDQHILGLEIDRRDHNISTLSQLS